MGRSGNNQGLPSEHHPLSLLIALINFQYNESNVCATELQNWDKHALIKAAQRHRVIPQIYSALINCKELPVSEKLTESIRKIYINETKSNLKLIHEILVLNKLFLAADIPVLFLKGPVLSEILYKDSGFRQTTDIDLIIPADKLTTAFELLENEGFYCDFFQYSPSQRNFIIQYKSSLTLFQKIDNHKLELHWKLLHPEGIYNKPFPELYHNKSFAEIHGTQIPTLSAFDYFLYLSIHGSLHRWSTLNWLLDVFILLKSFQIIPWQDIKNEAEKYNIMYCICQGITMVNRIFQFPLPSGFGDIINNKNVQYIISEATKNLNIADPDPSDRSIRRLSKVRYYLKLKKEPRYKVHVLINFSFLLSDFNRLKLPDSLFFLYFILRPVFWFYDVYLFPLFSKWCNRN